MTRRAEFPVTRTLRALAELLSSRDEAWRWYQTCRDGLGRRAVEDTAGGKASRWLYRRAAGSDLVLPTSALTWTLVGGLRPPEIVVEQLEIADVRQRIGQERTSVRHDRRALDHPLPGHGADGDGAVTLPDPGQLRDPVQVDDDRGTGEPEVQQRDQTLAARQRLGLLAVAAEQGERLRERRGCLVVEPRGLHAPAVPAATSSLVTVVRATSRPPRTTWAGGRWRVSASFTLPASHTSRSPASPGASP